MENEEVEKVLEAFILEVVTNSKAQLSKKNINASKDLSNSLKGDVKVNPNSLEVGLYMEDYGKFIDKGVKGAVSSKKAPLSPYRYRSKKPPVRFLQTWLKQKTGRFRQKNQRSIAFAIQNTVFREGIRTTNFFTKPFEDAFKKLPDELVEAYGLDLEDFIEFTLKTD